MSLAHKTKVELNRWRGGLPYLVFLILALWAMRKILLIPGIIGHSWDWATPVFPEQSWQSAESLLFVWDDIIGGGSYNPLKSLYFHWLILPFSIWDGEFYSKLMLVGLLWSAASAMYLLMRRQFRLNVVWSTCAGVLYMFSPATYLQFVAGYLNVSFAYVLFPILVMLCLQIVSAAETSARALPMRIVAAGVILGLIQAFHSSMFALGGFATAIILLLGFIRVGWRRMIAPLMIVPCIGVMMNFNWIMPFGLSYVSSGSLFHGGAYDKPTDQITAASVSSWRQNVLFDSSPPLQEAIRMHMPADKYSVLVEYNYPIAPELETAWLVASFTFAIFAFAALLSTRAKINDWLSVFAFAILGVTMVGGVHNLLGEYFYQLLKTFLPPIWAEFGVPMRALPILSLAYAALAPMTCARISERLDAWNGIWKLALAVCAVSGVTVWASPFLAGNLNQPAKDYVSLNMFSNRPENRPVYDFLRNNPDSARMMQIPHPGIWGITDYAWNWDDMGPLSARPRFLAPMNRSKAWSAASNFAALTPSSRSGKLLGLAAVQYVLWQRDRYFSADQQKQYDAVLRLQTDLVPVQRSFPGTTILENRAYMPPIYAAPNATLITGSSDLLAPLSATPYLPDSPALVFSMQQSSADWSAVVPHAATTIVPFPNHVAIPSSVVTQTHETYSAFAVETRALQTGQNLVYASAFSDAAVASSGVVSITHTSDYVVRVNTHAVPSEQVVEGQPSFLQTDSWLAEMPSDKNWKRHAELIATNTLTWTTSTLFDKRMTPQGLVVRASLMGGEHQSPYVEFTKPISAFDLNSYPYLQIASQAQDSATQMIQMRFGLDWDSDGGVDDEYVLPMIPQAEMKITRVPLRDAIRNEFPNKPIYRLATVVVRLMRRPKADDQQIQSPLYTFGVGEISFRSGNSADDRSISFLAPQSTNPASPGIRTSIASQPNGMLIDFPSTTDQSIVVFERALEEWDVSAYPAFSLSYQADGTGTFAVDAQISGADASGASKTIALITQLISPFSGGKLVFELPSQPILRHPHVHITVSRLNGATEWRSSSLTLEQFQIFRQQVRPYAQAQSPVPMLLIDQKPISISRMPPSADRPGTWFSSQSIPLSAGIHSVWVGYDDSMTPYRAGWLEIAPIQTAQPTATLPKITFRQINSTRWQAHIEDATASFFLVFSSSFHDGWKAYVQSGDAATWYEQSALLSGLLDGGRRSPFSEHVMSNGFSNAWYVNQTGNFEVVLEFEPQRLYEIGIALTLGTPVVAFLFLGILNDRVRRRRRV